MQIILSHIDKSYSGKPVLRDVSVAIRPRDAVVVTGPSGIGKTTLLRILMQMEKPDGGAVRLCNDDGSSLHRKCHYGVVFQEDRLLEKLSAVENVMLVMAGSSVKEQRQSQKNVKKTGQQSEAWARQELSALLPSDELDKKVSELSGGMRRRVCLVRAMIQPKDIYVLDEPFTGLDEKTRDRCIRYIRSHQRTAPLVISAHDLNGLEWMKEYKLPAS